MRIDLKAYAVAFAGIGLSANGSGSGGASAAMGPVQAAPVTATSSSVSTLRSLTDPQAGLIHDTTRVPKEDWPGAREKYRRAPAWTSWVDSRKRLVDQWTAHSRERADLIGGWPSDYIDPVTKISLSWTVSTPEPPNGGTEAEIKLKRAWVWHLRAYNVRMTGEAAKIFAVTGDARYGEWAAKQLDFYAANYNAWPLRTINGRGRMYQTGLDEATSAFDLLNAARLLQSNVDAKRYDAWRTGLFLPMQANLKVISSPLSNISLWQSVAVAAIGLRLQQSAEIDWALNSTSGIRATLAAAITTDHLWYEGNFGYLPYILASLQRLVIHAHVEGQPALVSTERTAVAKLLLAPIDYRFEDEQLPTPGDSQPRPVIDPHAHLAAYRVVPTWWGLSKANATQNWDILIDPPEKPAATQPALPEVSSRHFPANRMAVLRAAPWQVFVHYGQLTGQHAQAEALSYELYEGRTPISTDSGTTTSYASPFHGDYFALGPANNVPLIDGKGQQKWGSAEVESFSATSHQLSVNYRAYAPDVDVRRNYAVNSSGFSETSRLQGRTGTRRRLGQVFHSGCRIKPFEGLTASALPLAPPANPATAYWKNLSSYRAGSQWAVELNCGTKRYLYRVSGPAAQTVFIAEGPTHPAPSMRPLLYYEANASSAEFNATIQREP